MQRSVSALVRSSSSVAYTPSFARRSARKSSEVVAVKGRVRGGSWGRLLPGTPDFFSALCRPWNSRKLKRHATAHPHNNS